MHSTRTRWAVIAIAVVAAFASPAAARADAVTDWNLWANTAIFSNGPTAHASTLSTAMVQGAVYDAVNAIAGGYQTYLPTPAADPMFSQAAAAATAAFKVAAAVAPSSQLAILQGHYDDSLAAIANGPAKTGGIAVGEAAAAAMLANRANDGRGGASTFVFGTAPGQWRLSPPTFGLDPAAWVGNVTPFMLPNAIHFRTADTQGAVIGKKVAHWERKHFFQPVD